MEPSSPALRAGSAQTAAGVDESVAKAVLTEASSRTERQPKGSDQRASKHYRPDIDGLRALAVLPIVAFHLGFDQISGGYVGVDIFFVVSGYLIGGNLLTEIDRGSYSVRAFYARRFRRIAPALVAMLMLTTVAMWFVALPREMAAYGGSLAAAALSVSNIYFWNTINYFAPAAEFQPLLHTWSLAVEEQYYILFPALLVFTRRGGRRTMLLVVGLLGAASFLASIIGVSEQPLATFYLLPTRLWELLLGVFAVVAKSAWLERRANREAIALVGIALIGAAVLFYQPTTPFPGLAALPPCLGTALLLLVGSHGPTSIGRGLSVRPLVFFGLISYSLYLWHWPVLFLLKQSMLANDLSRPWMVAAFILSTLLGWLSWQVVERPWRNPAIRARTIFGWTGASLGLTALIGVVLIAFQGVPQRFPPRVAKLASILDVQESNNFRIGTCFISSEYRFADFDRVGCLRTNPRKKDVLVLGDSHAAHLWSGLATAFPNVNFLQATASGCKPVVTRDPREKARCGEMMRFLFKDYLLRAKVDWVLVSANWSKADLDEAEELLEWFHRHGIKVMLAGPVVRYEAPLPRILAVAEMRGDHHLVDREREKGMPALDRAFAELARLKGAAYLSAYQALCGASGCRTLDDAGLPVQFDRGHLTHGGSVIVASHFPIDTLLVGSD